MHKQDYLRLALAISSAKPIDSDPNSIYTHKKICENIAEVLKQDNPSFNTIQFLKACGVEDAFA